MLVLLRNHFLNRRIVSVHVILYLFKLLRQLLHLLPELVSVFYWRSLQRRQQLLDTTSVILKQFLLIMVDAFEVFHFDARERVFTGHWLPFHYFRLCTALEANISHSIRLLKRLSRLRNREGQFLLLRRSSYGLIFVSLRLETNHVVIICINCILILEKALPLSNDIIDQTFLDILVFYWVSIAKRLNVWLPLFEL